MHLLSQRNKMAEFTQIKVQIELKKFTHCDALKNYFHTVTLSENRSHYLLSVILLLSQLIYLDRAILTHLCKMKNDIHDKLSALRAQPLPPIVKILTVAGHHS